MSGWVKWEKDLETDPRFIRLVRHVRNRCVTDASHAALATTITVGALVKFWSYADTHIRENDVLDLGLDDIDELVGLSGFASGIPEDWLAVIDDATVELPGYQQHNGVEARKRDLARKRMERKRLRDRHADVTRERDERYAGASPDQTRPDQTKTKTTKEKNASTKRGTRATPIPIPDDWQPNETNRKWLTEAGLSPGQQTEVIAEFTRWASNSGHRKANWDLAFSRNPAVKSAVGRVKGKSNGSGIVNAPGMPGYRPSRSADELEAEAKARGEDIWGEQPA